jgi:WD40 repeat protein
MRSVRSFATFEGNLNDENEPSRRYLVSGDFNGLIAIWDIANRSLVHRLEGHIRTVRHLHPQEKTMILISGSYDGTVRVWDLKTGKLKHKLTPADQIQNVNIIEHPETLRERQKQVELDSILDKNAEIAPDCVYGMCIAKGRIFSGGTGGWVRVWDIESG